jgi:epoxyqueuosine reductase
VSISREELTELALDTGFSRLRIARVDGAPGIKQYDRFLEKELHGSMGWMRRSRPPRADPKQLLSDAKSVIVLGADYFYPVPEEPSGIYGRVSRYAWGKDYHKRVGKRLLRLCRSLKSLEPSFSSFYGVDSRPFIERAWAEISGLGFIGKNSMLISPGDSSFFFLGMILCNIDFTPDPPITKDHCGRCTRCLVHCPTDAFLGDSQLDARRCLSYLTIEHKGIIPDIHKEKMGRWLFGCDVCQDVCPHNHRPAPAVLKDFAPLHAWVDLVWLLGASPEEINTFFAGSPVRRAGVMGLRRNAAICIGNIGDSSAKNVLYKHERSSDLPVREAVRWSLDRLGV